MTTHTQTTTRPAAGNDNAGVAAPPPEVLSMTEALAMKGAARSLLDHRSDAMMALCDLLTEAYVAGAAANDNRA